MREQKLLATGTERAGLPQGRNQEREALIQLAVQTAISQPDSLKGLTLVNTSPAPPGFIVKRSHQF